MADAGLNQKEFKKLMKTLKVLPAKVQKNVVNGSTRAATMVIQREMKSRVPYEYGTLEENIVVKKQKSKKTESIYSATIRKVMVANGKNGKLKNTKQYAYYLEYGTSKMPSQPFIRPSLPAVGERPLQAARAYFAPAFVKQKKKLGLK